MEQLAGRLVEGVAQAAQLAEVPVTYNRVGSMFTWFFTPRRVTSWEDAAACETPAFARYFRSMLEAGIYLPPSQFEAVFLSAAHTEQDVEQTVAAAREAFMRLNAAK
jgi:glutamate-1-semialdehyde 2,1-aminomutase